MNLSKKLLSAVCSAMISGIVCAFSVSAATTYELEINPTESNGQYGQSVTYHTALATTTTDPGEFDPTLMGSGSLVHVEYETSYTGDEPNVELIWQTWKMNGVDKNTEGVEWAKVEPSETGKGWADFSYEHIFMAYHTKDFSEVYAICVGDAGYAPMTVTSLSIIIPDESDLTATETEAETEAEEIAEETEAVEETASAEAEETEAETEPETEAETEEETTVETTVTTKATTTTAVTIESVTTSDSTFDIIRIVLIVVIVILVGGIGYLAYILIANAPKKPKK